ncbi:hypothetical protein [Streptomyces apocyni]|uniref:hypothetical protein n=1 Tax=Streptomyces apocyni TaxID=2654677 RepID=UPI0012EACD5F|nr:hypothetical protein [Streptomyces apocyni]
MSEVTPAKGSYWRIRRAPLLFALLFVVAIVVTAIRNPHGVLGPITEWASLSVGLIAAVVAGGFNAATERKLLPALLVGLMIGYVAAGVTSSLR